MISCALFSPSRVLFSEVNLKSFMPLNGPFAPNRLCQIRASLKRLPCWVDCSISTLFRTRSWYLPVPVGGTPLHLPSNGVINLLPATDFSLSVDDCAFKSSQIHHRARYHKYAIINEALIYFWEKRKRGHFGETICRRALLVGSFTVKFTRRVSGNSTVAKSAEPGKCDFSSLILSMILRLSRLNVRPLDASSACEYIL